MICTECQTDNAPNASHCLRCGAVLAAPVIAVPELPVQPQVEEVAGPPLSAVAPPPPLPISPPPANYAPPMPPAAPPYGAPGSAPLYGAPPPNYAQPYTPEPNILDAMVPARNPKALIGYYVSLFSIIPLLGIALGIAGLVLGLQGLKAAKENPAIKGKTHAWVAIIVGSLFGIGQLIFIVFLIIVALLASSHSSSSY